LNERREGAPKGGYFSLYLAGTWMASRFVLVGLMTYGFVAASEVCGLGDVADGVALRSSDFL